MIPCICLDDKNKPADLPASKWIKEEDQYHVTFVTRCLPQNVLGFSLYEKPLGEDTMPYQYFISTRFGFTKENGEALMQMYKDLGEAISDKEMKELFENSNLQTA